MYYLWVLWVIENLKLTCTYIRTYVHISKKWSVYNNITRMYDNVRFKFTQNIIWFLRKHSTNAWIIIFTVASLHVVPYNEKKKSWVCLGSGIFGLSSTVNFRISYDVYLLALLSMTLYCIAPLPISFWTLITLTWLSQVLELTKYSWQNNIANENPE